MTGLDTNVLVRYIMQDDVVQSRKAVRLLESLSADEPGLVTALTVVELYWVLSKSYGLSKPEFVRCLRLLLSTQELVVERDDVVTRALKIFEGGPVDFADCLIEQTASALGCVRTLTFDVKAAKHAGMVLID